MRLVKIEEDKRDPEFPVGCSDQHKADVLDGTMAKT